MQWEQNPAQNNRWELWSGPVLKAFIESIGNDYRVCDGDGKRISAALPSVQACKDFAAAMFMVR